MEERRGSAAGTGYFGTNCPKVQTYKNARTAGRYAGARNYIIIIVLIYYTYSFNRCYAIQTELFADIANIGIYCTVNYITIIPPHLVQDLIARQN